MKVMHLITGLNTGGAEIMLHRLLANMDGDRFENEVVSLTDIGPVGGKIRGLNVPVRALGMRRGAIPGLSELVRLARVIRAARPQVIQTWLYHADLMGALAARLAGNPPVVWSIHHGPLGAGQQKRLTHLVVAACARLSHRFPRHIVSCSVAARDLHVGWGYDADKTSIIPNGFDLTLYRPDAEARRAVRRELGLTDRTPLVGMAARFNPQKDHENFVRAAALLHRRRPDAHFLLCGDGLGWDNPALASWIPGALRDRFHLLGCRTDVPRLAAALDIAALSSAFGEAFPLAICEPMACGVPCAVTDVGDSALIVGDTGLVVPPRDPEALAGAWDELLGRGPEGLAWLGAAARRRIAENFEIGVITERYESLYRTVARPGVGSCSRLAASDPANAL